MLHSAPRRVALAVLLLSALLHPAHAAPKDDARRHFLEGLEAASEGNYEAALESFLAAQTLYPHPATMFNIAQAYRDMGDIDNAITFFALYRDAVPEKAAEIEALILALRQKQQRSEAPAADGPGLSLGNAESAAVLARLDALSRELGAISAELTEQARASTEEPPPDDGTEEPPPEVTLPVAPEDAFLTEAYEQVVVSAARYSQDPLDSPSTVAVFTAEDIHMLGVTRFSEILRRVAGVDIFEAAVGNPEINIRGFTDELANKVLVLIDGRSVYEDTLGTTFEEAFPIVMEEIERVEIIRGPGSAVYGANAVTGVINIITRTPGEGKNSVQVQSGAQAHPTNFGGYTNGSAVATGRSGSTAYRLSSGFRQAGSWQKDYDAGDFTAYELFSEDQDTGLQSLRMNGRIDQTIADNAGVVSVSGGYSDSTMEFLNQGVLNYFGADYKHRYIRGDVFYGPFHIRGFWNNHRVDFGPWESFVDASFPLFAASTLDAADLEAESYADFDTGSIHHRINGGLGYRFKQNSGFLFFGADGPTFQEHHYAAFLQDELSRDKTRLLLSFRYDLDPNIDPTKTFSPRVSLIQRVAEQTSIRANAGTAFRAPNMVENYINFALPSGLVDGIGVKYGGITEQLDPERILSTELGLHDRSTLFHEVDVALYFNQLTNRLDIGDPTFQLTEYSEVYGGYLAGVGDYVNREQIYRSYGAEVDLSIYPAEGIDVFANFTFQNILRQFEENNNAFALDDDQAYSVAKTNLGVAWRTKYRTDLSMDVNYASGQLWLVSVPNDSGTFDEVAFDVPYRLHLNARIATRPLVDEKLEIGVIGWNLLGFSRPTIEHGEGQPISGRLLGSLRYSF